MQRHRIDTGFNDAYDNHQDQNQNRPELRVTEIADNDNNDNDENYQNHRPPHHPFYTGELFSEIRIKVSTTTNSSSSEQKVLSCFGGGDGGSLTTTQKMTTAMMIPLPKFFRERDEYYENNNYNNDSSNKKELMANSICLALPIFTNFFIRGLSSASSSTNTNNSDNTNNATTTSTATFDSSSSGQFSLLSISRCFLRSSLGKILEVTKRLRSEVFPVCGFVIPQVAALVGATNNTISGFLPRNYQNNNNNTGDILSKRSSDSSSTTRSSVANNHHNHNNNADENNQNSTAATTTSCLHQHQQQEQLKHSEDTWWWIRSDAGCPRHGPFSCSCRSWASEAFLLATFLIELEIWSAKFVLPSGEHQNQNQNLNQNQNRNNQMSNTNSKLSSLKGRRNHHQNTDSLTNRRREEDEDVNEQHQKSPTSENNNNTNNIVLYRHFAARMASSSANKIDFLFSQQLSSNPFSSSDNKEDDHHQPEHQQQKQQIYSRFPIVDLVSSSSPVSSIHSMTEQIMKQFHQHRHEQQRNNKTLPPLILVLYVPENSNNLTLSLCILSSSSSSSSSAGFLFALEKDWLLASSNDEVLYVPFATRNLGKFNNGMMSSSSSFNLSSSKPLQHAIASIEEGLSASSDFCYYYFSSQYLFSLDRKTRSIPDFRIVNHKNFCGFAEDRISRKATTTTKIQQQQQNSEAFNLYLIEGKIRCSWCNLLVERQWPGKNNFNNNNNNENNFPEQKQQQLLLFPGRHRVCRDCDRILCGCPMTGCHHECVKCGLPVCGMCSKNYDGENDENENLFSVEGENSSGSPLFDLKICGRCSSS